MNIKNGEYSFTWSFIVIVLCSAVVAMGINDLDRHFARVHRQVTVAEMRMIVQSLHGRVNVEALAQQRRKAFKKARNNRDSELDSVIKFVKNILP